MMLHDLKTSSVFEEDAILDVESNEFKTPKRTSNTGLRVGLVFVVLSAVGLAGLNRIGAYPFNRVTTPMEYLSMAQDKLMAAFDVRALQDAADFKASFNGVIKEVGTADPSAMSMKATMKIGAAKGEWPTTIFTFIAKPGKQEKLAKKFKAIKQGIVDLQCEHSQDNDCKKMTSRHFGKISLGKQSVHFGKGEFVFIEVMMPKGPTETKGEKEMTDAFAEHDPRFTAELNFGRTIEDMYDNLNSNVLELPNGVSAKIGAGFASTIFAALREFGFVGGTHVDEVVKMLTGLAQLKERFEIQYKNSADLADSFGDIPTFDKEIESFKKEFASGPRSITKPMKGLQQVCDGVAGVVLTGLPMGSEVVVEFTNFHPSKVLNSLLS